MKQEKRGWHKPFRGGTQTLSRTISGPWKPPKPLTTAALTEWLRRRIAIKQARANDAQNTFSQKRYRHDKIHERT